MTDAITHTETQVATPMPEVPRAFAAPSVDVYESKDAYLVTAELPGVKVEDVKVDLEQAEVSLEARRSDQPLDFRRRLTLSVPVNAEAVTAKLEHGVLRLELPKAESAKPRTIPVS